MPDSGASLATLLEELADRAEASLPMVRDGTLGPTTGVSEAEQIIRALEKGGSKAWELALFELRLESQGKPRAYRETAADFRALCRRREALFQGLLYPLFLSLFLAAALTVLRVAQGSGAFTLATGGPPVSPLLLSSLTVLAVLFAAALPAGVIFYTRKTELPGRFELLILLRESLLLSSSLGSSLQRLRRALSARGLHWKPLEAAEGRLEEGGSLPFALEPLRPPLSGTDLRLMETHPERTAATSLLNALIHHRQLRIHCRDAREAQLLPAVGLILVGLELLLIVLTVILPMMDAFLSVGLS